MCKNNKRQTRVEDVDDGSKHNKGQTSVEDVYDGSKQGQTQDQDNKRGDKQIKEKFRGLGYTTTIKSNAQLMD